MRKMLMKAALLAAGICSTVFGQHTENRADQTLRSTGRVNPSTLALEIEIPLGGYPGRGVSLPINLSYTSKVWRLQNNGLNQRIGINNQTCYSALNPKYSETSAAGWSSSLGFVYVEYTGETNLFNETGQAYSQGTPPCSVGNSSNSNRGYIKRVEVHLPNGETHELRASDTPIIYNRDTATVEMTGTYYAVDGSNLKYTDDGNGVCRLYLPNGGYYDFAAKTWLREARIRKATHYGDPNGNQITYGENSTYPNGYWTDTLGRVIPVPLSPTTAPAMATVQDYQLPGMSNPYHFVWQQLKGASAAESGLTDFNLALKYAGVHSVAPSPAQPNTAHPEGALFHDSTNTMTFTGNDPLFNPIVLTEIQLPDGSKYKFSYNIYGEIEKIVYPTGGEEHLTLNPVAAVDGISQETPYLEANRGVTQRQIYENAAATPQTWTYATGAASVTLTAPDGTRTERMINTFSSCDNCGGDGDGDWGFNFVLAGMPAEERSYSAPTSAAPNGQLLSKKLTTWTKTEFNVPTSFLKNPEWFPRVTKEETIIYDPATGSGISTTTALEYEGDLNQRATPLLTKKSSQYAFVAAGAALPANPVRTSETTYLQNDPLYATVRGDYLAQNMVGLATVAVVKDGAGIIVARSEMKYDAVDSSSARGNPTDARVWDNTKGNWDNPAAYLATHARFDTHGNRVEMQDAKGNTTTTVYDATYQAFPVSVTTPAPGDGVSGSNTSFTTGATFDQVTGLPLTTTDANGVETRLEYDVYLRPKSAKTFYQNSQIGSQAETIYHDTPGNLWVKSRMQTDTVNWAEATTYFDGLGRAYKTEKADLQGNIFVETEFDDAGRAYRVTNPYRAGEAKVWATNVYDEAGRIKEVDLVDGAKVMTIYGVATGGMIGVTKQITDQAGKKRKGISDALGRMVRVIEDPAGQNLATDYVFDTLGNLRQTIQGEQSRYFNYDSLGRLLYAKQPEQEANAAFVATDALTNNTQWSVKYEYDDNSNITKTTDARNVSISGTYDHFNRLTFRDYSDDTPDVNFFYDGIGLGGVPNFSKGKTTKVTSNVSETRYTSFDNLGRLLQSEQRTPFTDSETIATAASRVSSYQYDNFGKLLAETYPSGRTVNYDYNQDGKVARIGGAVNGQARFYANGFSYDAAENLTQLRLGNGKWETAQYNTRLQVTQIGLGSSANDTSLLKLEFGYNTAGQTDNNGSLRSQKISFNGLAQPFEQTYAYDSLNRLQSATETINNGASVNWKQSFSYDRFGNRRFDAVNTTNFTSNDVTNPAISTATNRLSSPGYVYDKNGNLTNDATGKLFAYDAESHQKEVRDTSNNVIGTYLYDGEGKRVKKISATETTLFVYDGGGQLVAEYSTVTASPQDAKISYLTDDYLGSARVITDQSGQVIARKDYGAFGDEIDSSQRTQALKYQPENIRQDYTGYEKDDESGLEFAQARYYNTLHGRFTSVDPLTASENTKNPQSFNRYTYALNSPYKFTDPLGLIYGEGNENGRHVVKWFDGALAEGFTPLTQFIYALNGGFQVFNPTGAEGARWVATAEEAARTFLEFGGPATAAEALLADAGVAGAGAIVGGAVIYVGVRAQMDAGVLCEPRTGYCSQYQSNNTYMTDSEIEESIPPPETTKPVSSSAQPPEDGGGQDPNKPTVPELLASKNFKDHFIRHKSLIESITGNKYPKFKESGGQFLKDVQGLIDDGTLKYVGEGTLKKDQPGLSIYRGSGVTVAVKTLESGAREFVTAIKSGEGLDLAIHMVNR